MLHEYTQLHACSGTHDTSRDELLLMVLHIEVLKKFDNMYLSCHIATDDVVARSSLKIFDCSCVFLSRL